MMYFHTWWLRGAHATDWDTFIQAIQKLNFLNLLPWVSSMNRAGNLCPNAKSAFCSSQLGASSWQQMRRQMPVSSPPVRCMWPCATSSSWWPLSATSTRHTWVFFARENNRALVPTHWSSRAYMNVCKLAAWYTVYTHTHPNKHKNRVCPRWNRTSLECVFLQELEMLNEASDASASVKQEVSQLQTKRCCASQGKGTLRESRYTYHTPLDKLLSLLPYFLLN